MKNNRGISVLALVITVVVIIILTSITVSTGINLISDARKKSAEDKLTVMCNALRKDDSFLESTLDDVLLTQEDFASLDLKDYYDDDYPVHLTKTVTDSDTERIITYTLNMYKSGDNLLEAYSTKSFRIVEEYEKNIYTISFDESKGVNRPLLSSNMDAITLDGSSVVNDVYMDNWYDYTSRVPTFAKMKYNGENHVYVWIPRFAYDIQTFYNGVNIPSKVFTDVPASAIKIVFLRGTSNYMSNNEVLPSEFMVHPAFSREGIELPGIWVSYEALGTATSLSSAISSASDITNGDSEVTSHLMSNSEFSAALYLMFALNDFDEIDFETKNEYVLAGLSTLSEINNNLAYADSYVKDDTSETGVQLKTGDAMIETNWDRLTGNYPTSDKPCILRLFKSGYFDFTSVSKLSGNYGYRAVMINQ